MPRKRSRQPIARTIALCYVRQSQTRDDNDMNSPDRQRENIKRVCEQHGWTPEWYEDVDGHKSGTRVKNRPGWLALKARMADLDVAAIVANDLSRLHRKGWRIGDLLDFVDQFDVNLVLAAPGKQMDFSTPQGRIIAQLSAIFDEWYAVDIAQRAKDSITHRKRKGITVGLPPFGTVRGDDGFLMPSTEGAWLMPDGKFQVGDQENPPHEDALWRGYYPAAERILQVYAEDKHGVNGVAYQMQDEGWAFRGRYGDPTPVEGDDVRRVVANWPEYGGFVAEERAKDRHPLDYPIEEIKLDPERAVFPTDLLYQVGAVRLRRTVKISPGDRANRGTYPYPLAGLIYCYHCEQMAAEHDNPKYRTRLGGKSGKTRRYRHRHGLKCGCTNRSVTCDIVHADFSRLLGLLTVEAEQVDLMARLGVEAAKHQLMQAGTIDLEKEKRAAVAKCQRKIEAARHLYLEGDLSREEYEHRKAQSEREMAHWESRTAETEMIALELTLCLEAIDRIHQLWDIGDDEDRQGMARNLFSYVVYNLDTQRIVDFRLKPWADRFVSLRASLYGDDEGKENSPRKLLGEGTHVPPTGIHTIRLSA